jgi:hypothetical protein
MSKCGKGKFMSIHKIVSLIILSGSILLLPVISFAQGGDLPCGGDDPTSSNPCPLDNWVWILAALAMFFGAMYLHRRQKIAKSF